MSTKVRRNPADTVTLGIDIGTTRVKAVLVGLDGTELGCEATATPWQQGPDGGLQFDVDSVAELAIVTAGCAAERALKGGQRVSAIGLTGMGESGALLGPDGRPVAPGYAWDHPFGDTARLETELGAERFTRITGLVATITPSIVKLDWLRAQGQPLDSGQRWLNMPEYVAWRLTGAQSAELSESCRTGLLRLEDQQWWDDALAFLGTDRSLLPGPPLPGGTILGVVRTDAPRALRGAAVAVGGHDHLTAAIGAGGARPGALAIDLGTAEAHVLCGTDLRILEGDYGHVTYPLVPGHEFAGHVIALGEGVTGFSEGDLAAADPNISCHNCEWCRRGATNLCEHGISLGITADGAMADQVAVPERVMVKLPADMDIGTAALIEPLSCVLHAADRAGLSPDRSLLMYGGGTIGLMFLAIAKLNGLHVSLIEPHAMRREMAYALGADAVAGASAELDLRDGLDYVLDASGAPAAISDGLTHLRQRGTFIQMGVAPSGARATISPYEIYANEWRLIGSKSVERCYQAAAKLMPGLADKLAALVTHRLPLAEFDRAVTAMSSPDAVKVHVLPGL